MTRTAFAVLAAGTLVLLWAGPVANVTRGPFSAHMTVHMGVVAVAAPLAALALAGTRLDPVPRLPRVFNAIVASVVELLVVWGWHAPAAHRAAGASPSWFALEQATFLGAGLWLWLSAFGGAHSGGTARAWTGVAGLLFTSIHMTLLGALFAVTPRPLYAMPTHGSLSLADQHLGGGVMLIVGGASYLAGGLWLALAGLEQSKA